MSFRAVVAFLASGAVPGLAQGPATLLLDLNTAPETSQASGHPIRFAPLSTFVLMSASGLGVGEELWRTDGTAAGTALVRDISLHGSSSPGGFTELRGVAYFGAQVNSTGQLWRTDGTPSGTWRVSATEPAGELRVLNGQLLFPARDAVAGVELWVSDGTAAGTRLFKDIRPGPADANPLDLTVVGNRGYFKANDGVHGRELWVTDGTAAGTVMVTDLRPGPDSGLAAYPPLAAASWGVVLAANDGIAGEELWRSDGTPLGTLRIADLMPGSGDSGPRNMLWAGGQLWFTASLPSVGHELCRSDGTPAGTGLVHDVRPGIADSEPNELVWTGTALLFAAHDGVHGRELWRSDGAGAGTALVFDINPGIPDSTPAHLLWTGTRLFCFALEAATGYELWTSDGTTPGTSLVRDLHPGTGNGVWNGIGWVQGMLLFEGEDGVSGIDLWRSDGTAAGTVLVKDFNPRGATRGGVGFERAEANGTLFFTGSSATASGLFKTDGTAAGTAFVSQVAGISELTAFASRVVFSGNDGVNGPEPWISDGTAAGTRMLANLNIQGFGSSPTEWIRWKDEMFFTAYAFPTRTLWRTNGTGVQGLAPPVFVAMVTAPIGLGDEVLCFGAQAGLPPSGLYRAFSRELLKPVQPVLGPFGLPEPVVFDGRVWFFAHGPSAGLWVSDGTPQGTMAVVPVPSSGSPVAYLTVAGDRMYFAAGDAATGQELWCSDGTAAGTFLVRDIRPGLLGSSPQSLTAFNDLLYFVADDGSSGSELWRSDGTAQGTWMVRDVAPGPESGIPPVWTPILLAQPGARSLLFMATDGISGVEMWRSDGTTAGTVLHQDVNPGPGSASPAWAAAVGNRILVRLNDGAHGEELWAMDSMAYAAPFGVGCPGGNGLVPTIRGAGGAPVLGNSGFRVDLRQGRPHALAALALGLRTAEIPVGNGCLVNFFDLAVTVFLPTDALGRTSVALPIPTDPTLRGAVVAAQYAVADPAGRFQQMMSLSPGLRIVVADN